MSDLARDRGELLSSQRSRHATFPPPRPRRQASGTGREAIVWLAGPVALSALSRTRVVGFDPAVVGAIPDWQAAAIAEQEGGGR
jgi:hypothetical protein